MGGSYMFDEVIAAELARHAGRDQSVEAVHAHLQQCFEWVIAADDVFVAPGWFFGANADPEAEEFLAGLAAEINRVLR